MLYVLNVRKHFQIFKLFNYQTSRVLANFYKKHVNLQIKIDKHIEQRNNGLLNS